MSSPDEFSIIDTAELANLRATVEELKNRSPESLTDHWVTRAKKAEAELANLRATVEAKTERIQTLATTLVERDEHIARLRKQVSQQNIDQMRQEDAKILGLIQTGNTAYGALVEQNRELKADLASVTIKLDFNYNQSVKHSQRADNLLAQLNAAERREATLERQIARLQSELTHALSKCRHGIVMKMQPDGSYNIKINNGPESFTVNS